MSKKDLTTALNWTIVHRGLVGTKVGSRFDERILERIEHDADVGGSGPDLYELNGPFLDFFPFFDGTYKQPFVLGLLCGGRWSGGSG
jgi:hypothetical protein